MALQYRIFETQFGFAGIAASPRGLRNVFLPMRSAAALQRQIQELLPEAEEDPRLLPNAVAALRRYFDGTPVKFELPLDLSGRRAFAAAVLRACQRIPYGKTATYRDLAARVGRPSAARAVGTVMSRNPLPIVIPCHRVLRSDGSLGGYSGAQGPEFKRRLLALERP